MEWLEEGHFESFKIIIFVSKKVGMGDITTAVDWKEEFWKLLLVEDASGSSYRKALQLKREKIPSVLYKYRPYNKNTLNELKENKVWLAKPVSLNDPIDSNFLISRPIVSIDELLRKPGFKNLLSHEVIEAARKEKEPLRYIARIQSWKEGRPKEADELFGQLKNQFEEKESSFRKWCVDNMRNSLRICSLTQEISSDLMWSKYSENHSSFCVEYDMSSIRAESDISRLLFPVTYSDSRLDLTEYFECWLSGDKKAGVNTIRTTAIKASSNKSLEWRHEMEWRIIFQYDPKKDNGLLWPFTPIKAVHLGKKIAESAKAEIVGIADKNGFRVIEV